VLFRSPVIAASKAPKVLRAIPIAFTIMPNSKCLAYSIFAKSHESKQTVLAQMSDEMSSQLIEIINNAIEAPSSLQQHQQMQPKSVAVNNLVQFLQKPNSIVNGQPGVIISNHQHLNSMQIQHQPNQNQQNQPTNSYSNNNSNNILIEYVNTSSY